MHAAAVIPETTRPPYHDQFAYLEIAIWRIDFRNRLQVANLQPGRYRAILMHLRASLTRARNIQEDGKTSSVHGGSALRLANALWSMEYRLLYPDDRQLRRQEERDASRVRYHHYDASKTGKNRVQAAIRDYLGIRGSFDPLFGSIMVPDFHKDDVFRADPFLKALRRLDQRVQNSARLKNRMVFTEIYPAIATARPDHRTLLTAVCDAAHAYAMWLDDPVAIAHIRKPDVFDSNLLTVQAENRAFLHSAEGRPLNEAIEKLLFEIRRPLT